jgi:hypothetical protein
MNTKDKVLKDIEELKLKDDDLVNLNVVFLKEVYKLQSTKHKNIYNVR